MLTCACVCVCVCSSRLLPTTVLLLAPAGSANAMLAPDLADLPETVQLLCAEEMGSGAARRGGGGGAWSTALVATALGVALTVVAR